MADVVKLWEMQMPMHMQGIETPARTIYTIILLKYVCRSSPFLLDRLGRCLKLFVSTKIPSSRELASQCGLEFFFKREKHQKTIAKTESSASVC